MYTGTQIVVEVKKINRIIVPSGLHLDKKIDRSFKLRSICLHIMRINLLRNLQQLLSNATNNINQIAKATNTTGVIYKKNIDYIREKIEKLAKKIWNIHSLLLSRSKQNYFLKISQTCKKFLKYDIIYSNEMTIFKMTREKKLCKTLGKLFLKQTRFQKKKI